jgi:uncharacterized protein YaaN involved in tellurite resistance
MFLEAVGFNSAWQLLQKLLKSTTMNSTDRIEMIQQCFEKLPNIEDSTKRIIKEVMHKKNALGQYLVKDNKDIDSLVDYLRNHSNHLEDNNKTKNYKKRI